MVGPVSVSAFSLAGLPCVQHLSKKSLEKALLLILGSRQDSDFINDFENCFRHPNRRR